MAGRPRAMAVVLVGALAALGACSGGGAAASTTSAPSPATASPADAEGCGGTPVRSSAKPTWAATAPDIRWVGDDTGSIAGFLFADPLRAGHPQDPANKVLWVVNGPRDGSSLEVELHPAGGTAPVVRASFPADSSPGEIYPSIVEVPTAGCWHATLHWNGRTAELDLRFV